MSGETRNAHRVVVGAVDVKRCVAEGEGESESEGGLPLPFQILPLLVITFRDPPYTCLSLVFPGNNQGLAKLFRKLNAAQREAHPKVITCLLVVH